MSTDLRNLSISELKRIKRHLQKKIKEDYNKKQKLIADINKLEKLREKNNLKPKTKTFDDYFQECIKNKTIPDTPSYFRKALEKALKEYEQGIIKEKSSLEEFAKKNIKSRENLVILLLSSLEIKHLFLKTFLEIIEISK